MKTLKELWNEKKMALKYGKIDHAMELNSQIMKKIEQENKK